MRSYKIQFKSIHHLILTFGNLTAFQVNLLLIPAVENTGAHQQDSSVILQMPPLFPRHETQEQRTGQFQRKHKRKRYFTK